MGAPSIVPLKVIVVPALSFPVTVVPAGNECDAAYALGTATMAAAPTPSAAISTFLCLSIIL